MSNQSAAYYENLSLWSISLLGVFTLIHHVYRLGLEVLIPFLIVTILPYILLRWFKHSNKSLALWLYGGFVGLVIFWFAFLDGLLDHFFKAIGLQNVTFLAGSDAEVVQTVFNLWSPEAGNAFYEGTGIITFILGVIAAYYTYRLLHIRLFANRKFVSSAM